MLASKSNVSLCVAHYVITFCCGFEFNSIGKVSMVAGNEVRRFLSRVSNTFFTCRI